MPRPKLETLDKALQELTTIKKLVGVLQPMPESDRKRIITYLADLYSGDSSDAPAAEEEAPV